MHFRFFKVPVYIDLSFWIFLFLVIATTGWQYSVSFLLAIVLAFSLFIHEYGHALVALFFDAEPVIILQAFGGKTEFNQSVITDKQKFLITLGGPCIQGLVALIAYVLYQYNILSGYAGSDLLLAIIYYINITWFVLNLIPIEPLDGGWLMRYILEKKFGHKGYQASLIIGLVAAAIAIPFLYLYGPYFFMIIQLIISGLQYCKLWQKERER